MPGRGSPRDVSDRFTESARQVVVAAQDQARIHRQFYVGTEHLLLGLLGDRDGPGAKTLEALDVGIDDVRQRVEDSIKPGQQVPTGPIPLTPRAETVMQLAVQEAKLSGHDEVDAVDILLGLIREGSGVAAQVLIGCGAELALARRAAASMSHWQAGSSSLAAEIAAAVGDCSHDLTEAARKGGLGPVIGRDREIGQLADLLSQYFARNPVLVCDSVQDAGTVLAGLAMRIAADEHVPEELRRQRIIEVHLEDLAEHLPDGPAEEVVSTAVAEISDRGEIVVCTDPLRLLMGEASQRPARATAIFKALLAQDAVKLIAVATLDRDESRGNVTFEGFERIEVTEPVTLHDIGELKLALDAARYFEV